jgi:hypothetical protein
MAKLSPPPAGKPTARPTSFLPPTSHNIVPCAEGSDTANAGRKAGLIQYLQLNPSFFTTALRRSKS